MQLLSICRLSQSRGVLALGLLFRVAAALAISPVFLAESAQAFELGVGYGGVEQGDDRLEPAATIHAGIDNYITNIYYYGRIFGPIRQDSLIIGLARRWDLFGTDSLSVNLGLSLLEEHVSVKYSDDKYKAYNNNEDNFNVGVNFGVAWAFIPKGFAPFWAQLGWDSHIYAAGLEGGILLSSGRKQVVTLSAGVEFK